MITTEYIRSLPLTGTERDILGCLQRKHDTAPNPNYKSEFFEKLSDFKAKMFSKYALKNNPMERFAERL